MSFGGLSMALRQTAKCLAKLAVSAGGGEPVDPSVIADAMKHVRGYCKHIKVLDKMIGYRPIIRDELPLFETWLVDTQDVTQATENTQEFLEYCKSILRRRVEGVHEFLHATMRPPPVPADPVWVGAEREALQKAMEHTLASWGDSDVLSVRDGLMELATQGWLPINPDLTLEFQRDVYIRRRAQEPFCFLSLLFVNLQLQKQ